MGKDSPSPPPAPDYTGAANATAQGNLEATRAAAAANRVNQVTPYGNLTYTHNPVYNSDGTLNPDAGWTATTSLSPAQQQLLDQQNKTSIGLAGLQDKGLNYVSDMLANKFDTSALPANQINAGQTAQDAIMSRLNPQFDQSENALRTRMANQGIAPGTEAWNNEFRTFNQGKNDAYTQAALQGMGIGQQARQQSLQEQAYLRNEPLNTLNAVRTGSQVTGPQFSSVPQQQTTSGADLLGATKAMGDYSMGNYNADMASQNSQTQGMYGLGSAALMAFAI